MEIGDTFLPARPGVNDHLQVVISDPARNPGQVVYVSLTSYDKPEHKRLKDGSCVLWPEDHPWIEHETCVSYRDGRVVSGKQLDDMVALGLITLREPIGGPVLDRVLKGAEQTEELPNKCRVLLAEQGLIES